ncbi:STAS domain-containing protein [Nannocystaceae bacterium ST9]
MIDDSIAARLDRMSEGMQFIQLMTRAFSSLRLTDRTAISDTLSSLTSSFFDCRQHALLLIEPDTGWLRVSKSEGFAEGDSLVSDAGLAFWTWAMADKAAQFIPADVLVQRWPDPPAELLQGFACVTVELMDQTIGVMLVAGKLSRQPFTDEELTFLACAAGLASMALANAGAIEEQDAQRWLAEDRAWQAALETQAKQRALAELDKKLEIIEQQQQAIMELSTPVLQLADDVVAMPIIGVVDSRRGEQIMDRLMTEVASRRARYVILDVTGVEMVDTSTADQLLRVARTAELLGATCVFTGIRPAVAQTLVSIGADLRTLVTVANVGLGLAECRRRSQASAARQRVAAPRKR